MTHTRPTTELHAWVDESIHVRANLYLLAAAVTTAAAEDLDTTRLRLRAMARRTRGRTHWNSEDERDRLRISRLIGDLPLTNIVVTATRIDPRRQERARRKCMQQLLHKLASGSVTQVWFESRDEIGNRRDLAMVANLRTTDALPPTLRVDHAKPLEEPLLWVPDAVAGAVAAAHDGRTLYRACFEDKLEEAMFEL